MSDKHFNGLTAPEDERLALLAEECAEVIHAITKIQRHGFESRHPDGGPTNRETLERELGDLGFATDLVMEEGDVDRQQIDGHATDKGDKVSRYLHHQRARR